MTKVIINGVEYIPKNNKLEKIEEVHKKQNEFIKQNNLKVGSIIITKNKDLKLNVLKITHIHSIYGWIQAINENGWHVYNIPIENIIATGNLK